MKKVLILTGSPKPLSGKSSTSFMAKEMKNGMPDCEIKRIIDYEPGELIAIMNNYDTILLFTPNYIHSLPAYVLRFLHALPKENRSQKFGVFVQSGFPNESESEIIGRFLDYYLPSTGYQYIGRVIVGDAAGYGFFPNFFKKQQEYFKEFGKRLYEKDILDEDYLKEVKLCGLKTIPPKMERKLKVFSALGITKISWCIMLRQQKGYRKRFDQPFLCDK